MMSRVCRVSVALLASLTLARVCMAAEPYAATGKGGIGGQIGFSSFKIDRVLGSEWFDDYSSAAGARLAFHAHWRYQVTPWLRWQIGTGFTWAGYKEKAVAPLTDPNFPRETTKENYLTLLVPSTAQLHYVLRRGPWIYYGGAGPGVYRVWIENHRKVLKDPVTLRLHRGLYPGGSAEFGVERYFKALPSTSLELAVAGHLALAQRPEQFPSGFESNVMAVEVRFGGNYSFTPGPRKAPPATTSPQSP